MGHDQPQLVMPKGLGNGGHYRKSEVLPKGYGPGIGLDYDVRPLQNLPSDVDLSLALFF
jgi:hypothetical protein